MRDDYFNADTYAVIDRITGEEVPIQIFIQKASDGYWEKAFAKTLAEYIGVTGSSSSKVLAYIIKNKRVDNYLLETVRGIAEATGASPKTVSTVFKALSDGEFLKKMHNGCYLVSPHLLRHGSNTRGAALIRLWENT